jgi:NADH dehydrogenase
VTKVHLADHQIELGNGTRFSYDYLCCAVGARHSYFGKDAWETYAPGLKTVQDAIRIREQILISFEKAERLSDHGKNKEEVEKYLSFVIVGGGPTGVEMAGAIAEIAHQTLKMEFRHIKPENAKIYLIEGLPAVLNVYPPALSTRAKEDLEKMGVQVLLGEMVSDINARGVQTNQRFIESENIIWAAGNQAPPLLKSLGVPLDKQGRVLVEPDLSVPGYPDVFVIGDASNCPGKDGKPLPGVATTAIQQGAYVAKLISGKVPKPHREPFAYFDKGSMATIGRCKAVALVGKFQFAGILAWLAWCFIHILYLIGFRNRLSVLIEWLICFFTGQRGARLIYRSLEKEIPPEGPR